MAQVVPDTTRTPNLQQLNQPLNKYYIGMVNLVYNESHAKSTSELWLRVGACASFSFWFKTDLSVAGIYNHNSNLFGFWLSRSLGDFKFTLGRMSKPIRFLNCPNPLTAGGHFQPLPKKLVPGLSNGVRFEYQGFHLGQYFDGPEKGNLNLGLEQKFKIFGPSPITLAVGGFLGQYKNWQDKTATGFSGKVGYGNLEFFYFQTNAIDSSQTKTFVLDYFLSENSGLYICRSRQYGKVIQLELGAYKNFSESISGIKVNYMLCAGYFRSKTSAHTFNLYFQMWLGD